VSLIKHLPNAITCGNLFCGCLAILRISEGDLRSAAYLVGIALVLDFLDGFAARMLKAYSAIGKDLDSLADMVTFGLVPGFVVFKMIAFLTGGYFGGRLGIDVRVHPETLLPYAGFVITIFSALRLAKFNNDTRQSESFIGLPTPANAALICSLPLVYNFESFGEIPADTFLLDPLNMAILACLLSLLLITELPMFSLKFRNFGLKENGLRYGFLLLMVLLLVIFREAGISLTIVAYVLLSFVDNIFLKKEV
jgi:CDP-diacylglycerol---serine O-phosphatidyltransferase